MYFNDRPFPDKESGNEAFVKCFDDKSAEEHCPERYKAMKTWVENTEKASNLKLCHVRSSEYQKSTSSIVARVMSFPGGVRVRVI